MKKTVAFLVALLAVTTSLSAQNSNIEQGKTSDLEVQTSNQTKILAGRVANIISIQTKDSVNNPVEFTMGGLNCPICNKGLQRIPLVLIDGLEVPSTMLEQIKPEDIDSFSILKDANAIAICGTRGKNGVLIITSKLKSEDLNKLIKTAEIQKQEKECGHTTKANSK